MYYMTYETKKNTKTKETLSHKIVPVFIQCSWITKSFIVNHIQAVEEAPVSDS